MAVDDRLRGIFLRMQEQRLYVPDSGRLKGGDGDGTSGGVSEDWKADVERRLGQLHDDVRSLARTGIAAAAGLAAMIGGLYFYFNVKLEEANRRLAAIEASQERLEGKIDTKSAELNGKLDLLLDREEGSKRK